MHVCLLAAGCAAGDVRLEDGGLSNQIGRPEICSNGRWNQICNNHWDNKDAAVICRQLGYTGKRLSVITEYFLYFNYHCAKITVDCLSMCNAREVTRSTLALS